MSHSDRPVAAITFDDGPSQEITPEILKLLSQYNIPATFSVLGSLVSSYPDIVREASNMNCEIVNHSWNHENFHKITENEIADSILRTEDAIFNACHKHTTFVRPPYGCSDTRVTKVVKDMNKAQLFWNLDSLDWKSRNSHAIISEVINNIRSYDSILLHDIYVFSYDAVRTIIPELLARDYELVTVSELFSRKGITIMPGERYP